jgi:FixJ family two-component response regulator
MRAVGSLSLRSGEMDFLVKPQLKKGLLKNAPLVAVSGKIERPVSRLATADESAQTKALFDQLPVEPRDAERPCQ